MLLEIADHIIWFTQDNLYFMIIFNALVVLAMLFFSRKYLVEYFKNKDRLTWYGIAAIMLIGIFFRIIDSTCTGSDGKTWENVEYSERLLAGKFSLSRADIDHAKGYALLLAAVFLIFGRALHNITILNIIFSVLTIPIVFFIVECVVKNKYAGFFAALIFAFMQPAVTAARFGSEHNIALFLLSLAFLFFLIYLEKKKNFLFILAAATLSMATHFRVECTIFAPLFLFYPLFFGEGKKAERLNAAKFHTAILLLFFLQFLAFYILLPIRLSYIEKSENPLIVWANGARGNTEETFDKKYPEIGKPALFSPNLWGINMAANIDAMINKSHYPVMMLLFILPSFLALKRHKHFAILVLWLFSFFLFFGLWWATSITTPWLYQILVLTPIVSLISIGVFELWMIVKKIKNSLGKIAKIIFILFLLAIFIFSMLKSSPLLSYRDPGNNYCITDELAEIGKSIEEGSCIVASSKGISRMSPYLVAKYTLERQIVVADRGKCSKKPIYRLLFLQELDELPWKECEKDCFYIESEIEKYAMALCKINC